LSDEKSSVTRTLRIDEEWDEALRKDAESMGTSVNALANQILKRYALTHRYFGRGQYLTISPQTLTSMISKLSREDIAKAGHDSGSIRPKDRLLIRGLPLTLESVIWYLKEILGTYNDWFYCEHHIQGKEQLFHLRHQYHSNWSIFLASYLQSMFKEILDINIDPIIEKDFIYFTLQHIP